MTDKKEYSETSVPVVIVGAGPVGLALAAELGRMRIQCLLIDKRDGVLDVPKMSQVSARAMEFCRRWGIAKTVRTAVWPEGRALDFVYLRSLLGRELVRLKIPPHAERDRLAFTPEGPCHCPQIYFDPILAAHVKSLPSVAVRYRMALESFEPDGDLVRVRIKDAASDKAEAVTARFMVGCDGAASAVREALGIQLGGAGIVAGSLNIFFHAPELKSLHDKGWARFYRIIDESGCWSELIPIDGNELWRLTVFDTARSGGSPDEYLRRMMGGTFPYRIISAQVWERRDYVADSYNRGNVFLAGDSAHQCSPTGGLGMHTGMEEAVNLAWKLAARLRGWGGEKLLDSYALERRPVALRNVAVATGAFRAIAAIPGTRVSEDTVTTYVREHLPTFSVSEPSKIDYAYEASPICAADQSGSLRPGVRAPHVWLDDERSTLDLVQDGFTLLRLGRTPPPAEALVAAAKARDVPIAVETLSSPEVLNAYGRQLALMRPDGHLAWTGDTPPDDALLLIDRVRGAH